MAGKKERQRKLAAQRYQRRAIRQAEQARRTRQWTAIGLICCVVVALAVGGYFTFRGSGQPASAASQAPASPHASPSASVTPTPAAAEPASHCTYTANQPAARKVGVPPAKPDDTAKYRATIHTNRGNVVIDLLNSKATCTVNSFVYLAQKKFYNVTPCLSRPPVP